MRENPVRAASLGIDTRAYTLLAFAIGSAYAGFAGALYAPLVEFIDPSPFSLSQSLFLLLMVVAGGAGYLFGPFVGALLGELWHGREFRQATKVGLGTWLGIVLGVVLKLGLAFAMLGLFVFAWIF